MSNISGGMKSLCENITTARGDRMRSMEDLKEQAKAVSKRSKRTVKRT